MADLYNDTFTAANGTTIGDHTADSGQSYSANTGYKIHNNRLYSDNITNNYTQVQGFTTSLDGFTITMSLRKLTDAGNMGITFGDTTGGQSGYLVRASNGQKIQFYSITFGPTFNLLDEHVFSIADDTDMVVKIVAGDSTSIYLDDVLIMTEVTSNPNIQGNLFVRQNLAISTTTGYHLDSLSYAPETPPYPSGTYTVDVEGTDSGYLQHNTATSGQTYGLNKGARLGAQGLYFDNGSSGEDFDSYIKVDGATTDTEYDIDFDFYKHTDTGNVGIHFAGDSTLSTGWLLRAVSANKIQLWESGGAYPAAYVFINEYVHATGDGASLPAVQAQVRSGQIEVFVGGVSRFTHSTVASKEGNIYLRGSSAVTSTTGYHLNDITYTSITDGSGGPLVYNDTFSLASTGTGVGILDVVGISGFATATASSATITAESSIVSNISGSISWTLSDDTWAGSASVVNAGNMSFTTDNSVLVGAGGVRASGSISFTTDDSILAAAGTVPIAGSLNIVTEDAEWLSLLGEAFGSNESMIAYFRKITGLTSYNFNELAIAYYKQVSGTNSNQFNDSLKAAQASENFVGLAPNDWRNL